MTTETEKKRGRGRPLAMDHEARRKQIFAAAMDVFNETGYADTTVDAIAKAAGVSKRTIYQHFKDKSDIFRSLFYDAADDAIEAFRRLEVPEGPEDEALVEAAKAIYEILLAEDLVAVSRLLATDAKGFADHTRRIMRRFNTEMVDALKTYVSRKMDEGRFAKGDPEVSAEVFVYAIAGFIERRYVSEMENPDVAAFERWATVCAKIYLRGALASPDA